MGLVKNGFVDLGNGMFINGALVDHVDGEYVILKNGEKYRYNELCDNLLLFRKAVYKEDHFEG